MRWVLCGLDDSRHCGRAEPVCTDLICLIGSRFYVIMSEVTMLYSGASCYAEDFAQVRTESELGTGRWDRHCTLIAVSAPLFILLSWVLPGGWKVFLGPVLAGVAFLLTLSSPPAGLYVALVAIL